MGKRLKNGLHDDVAAADRDPAVHGTGVAEGDETYAPVQARPRVTFLRDIIDGDAPHDRIYQEGREDEAIGYAKVEETPIS